MNDEIDFIKQIADKRGVSPEHVREETTCALDEMWEKNLLQGMFSQKPTVEEFIAVFATFISSMFK